jgi:hypothetical protein
VHAQLIYDIHSIATCIIEQRGLREGWGEQMGSLREYKGCL